MVKNSAIQGHEECFFAHLCCWILVHCKNKKWAGIRFSTRIWTLKKYLNLKLFSNNKGAMVKTSKCKQCTLASATVLILRCRFNFENFKMFFGSRLKNLPQGLDIWIDRQFISNLHNLQVQSAHQQVHTRKCKQQGAQCASLGSCKLQWFIFCIFMDFLQNVLFKWHNTL
jgi:hypothetical protein